MEDGLGRMGKRDGGWVREDGDVGGRMVAEGWGVEDFHEFRFQVH